MAYGKGYISGIITFLRSFLLLIIFLLILPQFFLIDGIWLSVPFSEGLTVLIALAFLISDMKKSGKNLR